MRIAFLGPAGTFTEDALREAAPENEEIEALRTPTVHDAILAVERGEAERALVPFENSIEGSVRSTLDTLAFDTGAVTIVGEHDFRVHAHLIAREGVELEQVAAVLSHPQPLAQCAGFLREQLPGVERRSVSSTAEAVRMVSESVRPWAAIGARAAADLYGCTVLREGIEDEADNVTRFVWIAPEGTAVSGGERSRTSLVFSELGEDHPGALVEALQEFSSRGVNLSRIESRPLRRGLGRYMFFCDLEGAIHYVHMTMERPDVIRLVSYVRVPREAHRRKITRRAVLARDAWTCQYCGSTKSGLTVDHVIPRSRGGKSVWGNIVAACASCNRRKGNRLPHEIQMHPKKSPKAPGPSIFIQVASPKIPPAWQQYLPAAA